MTTFNNLLVVMTTLKQDFDIACLHACENSGVNFVYALYFVNQQIYCVQIRNTFPTSQSALLFSLVSSYISGFYSFRDLQALACAIKVLSKLTSPFNSSLLYCFKTSLLKGFNLFL